MLKERVTDLLDDYEYTQKEANAMLRCLYVCNLYLTQHKFRKVFLRTATTQTLSAKRTFAKFKSFN